tara:strand:- start:519 stop:668 length:150 start_codon:yes stop_codon:yes gene_type:complete
MRLLTTILLLPGALVAHDLNFYHNHYLEFIILSLLVVVISKFWRNKNEN